MGISHTILRMKTRDFLEEEYGENAVIRDSTADFVVHRKVGRNLAVRTLESVNDPREAVREALELQIDGYEPVLSLEIDSKEAIVETTDEAHIVKYCSDAKVNLISVKDDPSYILKPNA